MRCTSALLVLTMLLGGCYSWTAIKPTELPKLNGASTSTSHNMGRQVTVITAAQVEAPDGHLVEIDGESDTRMQTTGQPPITFKHPVLASVDEQGLTIRSSNYQKMTIPLSKIQSVEVSQFERGQTSLAISIPLLLVGGLAILVILSRAPSSTSTP